MDRLFDDMELYGKVEAFALEKGFSQTLLVLPYAKEKHKNQKRKGTDNVPYIIHPLIMAYQAIALGLGDDDLLSAVLLHDVCEDCGVALSDLPVNEATREAVDLLTRKESDHAYSEKGLKEYFEKIKESRIASIVKILDRCNNVSGMAECFSKEKIREYISETKTFVYPVLEKLKKDYPDIEGQLFVLEYHMTSVVESIEVLVE